MRFALLAGLGIVSFAAAAAACDAQFAESTPPPSTDAGGGSAEDAGGGEPGVCTTPVYVARETAPDASCVGGDVEKLRSDPKNCGACGHVCPTSCSAGLCDVEVVAQGATTNGARLAGFYGERLFWVTEEVFAITPGEMAPTSVLLLVSDQVLSTHIEGKQLFISTTSDQHVVGLDAPSLQPNPNAINVKTDRGGLLATGTRTTYLASRSMPAIVKVPREQSTALPTTNATSGAVLQLFAYGDDGLWIEETSAKRDLRRFGGVKPLVSGTSLRTAAVSGEHIFVQASVGGDVVRVKAASSAGEPVLEAVAPEPGEVTSIVTDGTDVFFATHRGTAGWALVRSTSCGGRPLDLASGLGAVTSLVAGPGYLYAAIGDGGRVVRVAR